MQAGIVISEITSYWPVGVVILGVGVYAYVTSKNSPVVQKPVDPPKAVDPVAPVDLKPTVDSLLEQADEHLKAGQEKDAVKTPEASTEASKHYVKALHLQIAVKHLVKANVNQ